MTTSQIPSIVPLVIFLACYTLFVLFPRQRALSAIVGAVATLLWGPLTVHKAITEIIQWNVIGLFFGTLVLAELFMQSRMPAVIADRIIARVHSARAAMLALCVLSSGLSMFVENVAVVLLIAPIAFSLAQKLRIPPVNLLIGIAICSNLQGTATLIGDPPSMILAGYLKMNFNDFFFYHGKPSIFFAVQAGAVASLAILFWVFRHHRELVEFRPAETARSPIPSVLLVLLILGLATASRWDPEFRWFAGTYTCVLSGVGLIWYRLGPHWSSVRELLKTLDWDTTFFLTGIFVIVGGLSESGWIEWLAEWMGYAAGHSVLRAFVLIVVVSVTASAFVDNVPFLLAAIPVAESLAARVLVVPGPLLVFALLVGACLGGNITPIGASANVVTMGLLKREGYIIRFGEFVRIGLPFTFAAVAAGTALIWLVWSP